METTMMMIMMIDDGDDDDDDDDDLDDDGNDDDAQAGAVFIFQGEQFSLVYMLLNSWCLIWTIYGRHSRSPIYLPIPPSTYPCIHLPTHTSIYLTIHPSTYPSIFFSI